MTSATRMSHTASRRVILAVSAALGVAAIALIFAPAEIASALGMPGHSLVDILLQLYGAALCGLAMTGWMVKDAIVGGIFGRSYVVGNAGHSFVGALTLARPAVAHDATPTLQVIAAAYWILAVVFAYLMFMATPRS
jgi:hypothetical protein